MKKLFKPHKVGLLLCYCLHALIGLIFTFLTAENAVNENAWYNDNILGKIWPDKSKQICLLIFRREFGFRDLFIELLISPISEYLEI